MGIANARMKGKVRIKGRPNEQAKAEIMVMNARNKARDRAIDKQRRRRLFTLLDFVIILAFGLALYSIWVKEYINAILFLIVGAAPLAYFILRRVLRNKVTGRRR